MYVEDERTAVREAKYLSVLFVEEEFVVAAEGLGGSTEEDLNEVVRRASAAPERDRVLFLTGCTPQGRILYFAINLAE